MQAKAKNPFLKQTERRLRAVERSAKSALDELADELEPQRRSTDRAEAEPSEGVRLLATQLAIGGASNAEIESVLGGLGVDDPLAAVERALEEGGI